MKHASNQPRKYTRAHCQVKHFSSHPLFCAPSQKLRIVLVYWRLLKNSGYTKNEIAMMPNSISKYETARGAKAPRAK
jgi:hypothetical protein